jgi:hypothetical protein
MGVRLVVTGHNGDGKAVFVQDANVDPIDMPGAGYLYPFWSANEPAVYPGPGLNPKAPEFFPPVDGVRFFTMVLTPQGGAAQVKSDASNNSGLGSDLAAAMEEDDPGMHATDSTDFALVISGEVGLELDDAKEVTLTSGDTVVQNGTRHRWRLIGDEPATIVFVVIGAHRS